MNLIEKTVINLEEISNIYNSVPRMQQVQMGVDIENFLVSSEKKFLFLEAPVGTGKTLGTLVPSLLYGKTYSKNIVYATATKSLQYQIFDEDAKVLERLNILNKEDLLLAMGKSNYACIQICKDNKNRFSNEKRYQEIKQALLDSKTGLKRDINKFLKKSLSSEEWNNISMSNSIECNLPYICPGHSMRKLFNKNHKLIVTNHALIIQSQFNNENNYKPIIPIHKGVVIIDEAHLFLENFAGSVQQNLSLQSLIALKSDKSLNKIFKNIDGIIEEVKKIRNSSYIGRHARPALTRIISKNLRIILEELNKQTKIIKKDVVIESKNRYEELIDKIFKVINNDEYVSSLVLEENSISTIPINVYDKFSDFVEKLSSNNKVIFLSGTLTVEEDAENEIERNYGISKNNFVYKRYSSPFEVGKRTYFVIPDNIHEPNIQNKTPHIKDIVEIIKKVSNETDGGILVLSNSLEDMEKIAINLKKETLNRKILVQNDKEISELSEEFKNNKKSILIASGSYATGFSAPGDTLQTVILTSFPFPVPDDSLYKIQCKTFQKIKETQISLNLMLKKMDQEVGRLIRSVNDYGMIIICDPRVWDSKKNYAIKVKQHLEGYGYTVNPKLGNISQELLNLKKNIINQIPYDRSKINFPETFDNDSNKVVTRIIGHDKTEYKEKLNKLITQTKKTIKNLNSERKNDNKIKLRGINKVVTNKQLAQLIVDINYKYGLDMKKELLNIFPPEERINYMLLEPTGNISGPVKISYL